MRNATPVVISLAALFVAVMGCICAGPQALPQASPTPGPAPSSGTTAPAQFTTIRLRTADGALPDQLKAEAQKARALDRQPFVEFDADWCPPCIAIRETLSQGDERMLDAFAGTYIIQLDIDEWADDLSGTGFEGVTAIPAYYELDEGGKPTDRTITGAAWGDNIAENMAPPLKAFFQKNTN